MLKPFFFSVHFVSKMKLASFGRGTMFLRSSSSGFCSRKWNLLLYSTTASTTTDSLYWRVSRQGNPEVSIIPVLDQWVEEGRVVQKDELQNIVKELRRYGRLNHALQVSEWMSDKRSMTLDKRDMAARLDLIYKVHGTEEAENYFNNITPELKDGETCGILLNCYARSKLVEKAEATMQKMKDLGFITTSSSYNVMLNLYRKTGNKDKLDALSREMEENGVKFDKFTFGTMLTAYADTSDIDGMNRTLQKMESYPKDDLDWHSYSIAASSFVKAGDTDKALALLKKFEETILNIKVKGDAYDCILSEYAALGKKDEVLRLWEARKTAGKLLNKSYITVISSLLKLDDIEEAEKMFEEWESRGLLYDFRIPNLLVGAYCRKGVMEKAEELIKRAVARGGKPLTKTWYFVASGYVSGNQMAKAAEAMKLAVSAVSNKKWKKWKPSATTLAACLEYLKEKGDANDALELLKSLRSKEIISAEVHDRLFFHVSSGSTGGAPGENKNALGILMHQQED